MNKYIIFGAGEIGRHAIDIIGNGNIEFFIDNNEDKQKAGFEGFDVLSFDNAKECLDNYVLVLAISKKYEDEVVQQIEISGVSKYKLFREIETEVIRKKLESRPDWIGIYKKAISWVKKNTVESSGIIVSSKEAIPYPEVTGYFIPSLLNWGYRELARQYAAWLCNIQESDGSFKDPQGRDSYIFDTAQILKGLIAIYKYMPEIKDNIIKGCDWILSCMDNSGRLITPSKNAWADESICSELIHLYCLSPIIAAGKIFDIPEYVEKSNYIKTYYLSNYKSKIVNFHLLSHFYSYVIEALVDLGETDLARESMKNIEKYLTEDGAIPGMNNCKWICSTGLFQLSLIWAKLGDFEKAHNAFCYTCKLQNESGGWYGSYPALNDDENFYFPDAEISWAIKYFLDALYYMNTTLFENVSDTFLDEISEQDGRYGVIYKAIDNLGGGEKRRILDAGCGKGRYIKKLFGDFPDYEFYGMDISKQVLEYVNLSEIIKSVGSLTNMSYENNTFDIVYSCEAMEHAIDIKSAVREMARVTRPGGRIIIVDKNKEKLGFFEIEEWEQWFDEKELKDTMMEFCSEVSVEKEISYDDEPANGLFYAWVGKVK